MRRNYLSPCFSYLPVNGTLSMLEQSSFLGSKMLKIENNISIDNNNIIYYQNANGEQLDPVSESSNPPIIYNGGFDKFNNSTLVMDKSQSQSALNGNTQWILTINMGQILNDYIFALLKTYRTFNGIQNNMTIFNNVNTAISDYITKNVINQYQYQSINFYLSYNNLQLTNTLQYQNMWSVNIEQSSNLFNNISTQLDSTGFIMTIKFSQSQPSLKFSFNYYFDLFFNRI